jgi:hypothetical protein
MDDEDEPKPKRRLHEASTAAQRRWWEWKFRRISRESGRAIARHYIRWKERKRAKVLAETFETIKTLTVKSEHGKFQSMHVLNKMALYLLIAARDVQVAKLDALTHPDEWTRRLHARVILITVYEWDMDGVTGRTLVQAMTTMKIPDDLQKSLTVALRRLRKIRERVTGEFSFVRNAAIGHRDPDVLAQYRAIRDFDTEKMYDLIAEFFAAVGEFMAAHGQVYNASSSMTSFLAQWAEWESKSSQTPRN